MSTSAIHTLRHMTGIMRGLSATVLLAFTMLILMPTVQAAQLPAAKPTDAPAPVENVLGNLRDTALRARDKAEHGQGHKDEDRRLLQHEAELGHVEDEAEADFAAVEQHLESHGLPEEIKQRHRQAVADYRVKMQELKQHLKEFKDARARKDSIDERRRLNDLADFLQKEQKTRPHQPFDPKNLPFGTPDGKVRAPKEKKEELDDIIRPQVPVKVAATELTPGLLAAAMPTPGASPTPEDLAETEDVQITQAIRDQAAALHHNPVEIYNWVRNTIEFLPTYGSIQGSDLTLQTRRGNAFDTASLLIALLRASNIPARYAYGTIQVPADQVMNWVGGVKTPEAAQSLLGQGGIPTTALVSGGRIAAFKLEHVWVEAYVDYLPSRGAVHRVGDTWVPLDGSFKQYDYQPYVDLSQETPFNTQAFFDVFNNGSTTNLQEGWISGVNVPAVETAYQQANTEIQGWLDRVLGDGKDWRRLQKVVAFNYPTLLGSLPYTVIIRTSPYRSIPESQRGSFRFDLYASDADRLSGNAIFNYRISLPSLAGRRLTLGFAPATDADWAVIKSYLPNLPQGQALTPADLPSSLPGNLIRLTAVLLMDDQPIMRGGSFSMGQDVFSTTAISRLSGGFHEAQNAHLAGEFIAIGIDLQGYGNNQLTKSPVRTTVSVLHQAARAYFYRRDIHLEYLRILGQAAAYPAPSFGFFETNLTPRYWFGIPTQMKLNSVQIDVDAGIQILVPLDNNPAAKTRLMEQVGMALSAREHEIPESHLANDQYSGEGVSAVKALSVALAQGQRVYHVTSANLDLALAQTALSPEIEADIRNAINAGQVAVIHERPLTIGGWTGAGYILTDPRTGSGAYRIAGGLNGGAMQAEVAEGLALAGLTALASVGVALLEFAIPAAHADDGICGEAQQERVEAPSFATNLIAAVVLGILASIFISPVGGAAVASPQGGAAVAALLMTFTSAQAVAQARKDECYVYYIGNTDHKGQDISEVANHILGAIAAKQSFNKGMGIDNLTYASSAAKEASGISRQWYNSVNPGCGPIKDRPAGTNCDEYPWFSTHQGGPGFYPDGVSLKLVNGQQNQAQGRTVGYFYRDCFHYTIGTAFVVRPGSSTHGELVTRNGATQCWPRSNTQEDIPPVDE
jgi:transglutaminase-like putative cysteine protease